MVRVLQTCSRYTTLIKCREQMWTSHTKEEGLGLSTSGRTLINARGVTGPRPWLTIYVLFCRNGAGSFYGGLRNVTRSRDRKVNAVAMAVVDCARNEHRCLPAHAGAYIINNNKCINRPVGRHVVVVGLRAIVPIVHLYVHTDVILYNTVTVIEKKKKLKRQSNYIKSKLKHFCRYHITHFYYFWFTLSNVNSLKKNK